MKSNSKVQLIEQQTMHNLAKVKNWFDVKGLYFPQNLFTMFTMEAHLDKNTRILSKVFIPTSEIANVLNDNLLYEFLQDVNAIILEKKYRVKIYKSQSN
jgi:hypothetical protein